MKIYINNIYIYVFLAVIITGCVPQSEYDDVVAENKRLKEKLEECMYGAEKISAKINQAYTEKNYSDAKKYINLLQEKHPESPKNVKNKDLLSKILVEEKAEKIRKEAEEKERIRIKNLNNTGMWKVEKYVDNFGEETNVYYIKNKLLIEGVFSNSAAVNRDLSVSLLMDEDDFSIMLWEYKTNLVTGSDRDTYTISIQDKDKYRENFNVTLKSTDRLLFNYYDTQTVHKMLMKGGEIKFYIQNQRWKENTYKFKIMNADWYSNAYKKMIEGRL